MVHNGIEYGLMAAYAEGLNILKKANVGKASHDRDAETTPLRHPEHYQYDFNLADIAEVWRRGSVVASWLLDLTAASLAQDPGLDQFARQGVGFRRRALDAGRGQRRSGAGVRPDGCAVCAVRVSRRGRLSEPRALGDAVRVRRSPGEEMTAAAHPPL